jgi:hypothetical protein
MNDLRCTFNEHLHTSKEEQPFVMVFSHLDCSQPLPHSIACNKPSNVGIARPLSHGALVGAGSVWLLNCHHDSTDVKKPPQRWQVVPCVLWIPKMAATTHGYQDGTLIS